jgi:hypothetical protein
MDERRIRLSREGWAVYHRPGKDRAPWRNIVAHGPSRKFFLCWNGQRLAKNSEADLLRGRHPDISSWIETSLPRITLWE